MVCASAHDLFARVHAPDDFRFERPAVADLYSAPPRAAGP
jgi:hypothetical protein